VGSAIAGLILLSPIVAFLVVIAAEMLIDLGMEVGCRQSAPSPLPSSGGCYSAECRWTPSWRTNRNRRPTKRRLQPSQCDLGTESLQTRRWRRESRANPSLKREILAELRLDFFHFTPLKRAREGRKKGVSSEPIS
jgi:hypothetical protein